MHELRDWLPISGEVPVTLVIKWLVPVRFLTWQKSDDVQHRNARQSPLSAAHSDACCGGLRLSSLRKKATNVCASSTWSPALTNTWKHLQLTQHEKFTGGFFTMGKDIWSVDQLSVIHCSSSLTSSFRRCLPSFSFGEKYNCAQFFDCDW